MTSASMSLAMTDQGVIFLRLSPEEKAVITAAAARKKRTAAGYVRDVAVDQAIQDLGEMANKLPLPPRRACLHCGRLLAKGNKSDFCRLCQRTTGLPTLRKLHAEEVASHGKLSHGPPARRRKSK